MFLFDTKGHVVSKKSPLYWDMFVFLSDITRLTRRFFPFFNVVFGWEIEILRIPKDVTRSRPYELSKSLFCKSCDRSQTFFGVSFSACRWNLRRKTLASTWRSGRKWVERWRRKNHELSFPEITLRFLQFFNKNCERRGLFFAVHVTSLSVLIKSHTDDKKYMIKYIVQR